MINRQASGWASLLSSSISYSRSSSVSIFINDTFKHIGFSIRLFADDTRLCIIVNRLLQGGQLLNRDLNAISIWAISWLVTFNPSKTLSMLISLKRSSVFHPPISMDGVIIDETPSHKTNTSLTYQKRLGLG